MVILIGKLKHALIRKISRLKTFCIANLSKQNLTANNLDNNYAFMLNYIAMQHCMVAITTKFV